MTLDQNDLDEVSEAMFDIDPEITSLARKLRKKWPAVAVEGMDPEHPQAIPFEKVEHLGMVLTSIIGEVLQAWLDAGSERDVTSEELTQPITEHVWGWSDDPRIGPGSQLTFDQAREAFRKEVWDIG